MQRLPYMSLGASALTDSVDSKGNGITWTIRKRSNVGKDRVATPCMSGTGVGVRALSDIVDRTQLSRLCLEVAIATGNYHSERAMGNIGVIAYVNTNSADGMCIFMDSDIALVNYLLLHRDVTNVVNVPTVMNTGETRNGRWMDAKFV
jgi:hypothetical protein